MERTAQTNPPIENRHCSTSEVRRDRRHAAREKPGYVSGLEQLLPFGKNVIEGKEAGTADFGPTPEWLSGMGELPMRAVASCRTGSLMLASPLRWFNGQRGAGRATHHVHRAAEDPLFVRRLTSVCNRSSSRLNQQRRRLARQWPTNRSGNVARLATSAAVSLEEEHHATRDRRPGCRTA